MKCMVVLFAVVAVSSAAQFGSFGAFGRPQQRAFAPQPAAKAVRSASGDQAANILRFDSDVQPNGAYSYAYETDNGIAAAEQGTPSQIGNESPNVAHGNFAWTSPEGVPVSISYIADEYGYQPRGDALPVGPPVPPQIARALEWIAKNAPKKQF